MSKLMINPEGVKANMVCATCEHRKRQPFPPPVYWKNKCLKNDRWITDMSGYCASYKMGKFFVERGYKELKQ